MGLFENLTFPQALLAVVGLYIAWTLLARPAVAKSPLDNIPGPASPSFLTGNIDQLMGRHSLDWRVGLRHEFGRTNTLHGLYNQYWLFTHDPKALQSILGKDQDSYEEATLDMRIMLGPGLFGTDGERHRRQRKMLNPIFSIKHLRNMTPLFYEIIHKTRDAVMTRVKAGTHEGSAPSVELDMLSWAGRTTLEIIGRAGLGHSFDPLIEDGSDEFAKTVKDFFPQMHKTAVPRTLMPYVANIGSAAFRRRMLELIPNPSIKRMVEITDIFHARSMLIFNEKKEALARGDDALKHQIGEGRDIMSILLKANMYASAEDKLPDEDIVGQVSTMILAGMDTTANSIARLLQLLAENPHVQERLRAEILAAVEAESQNEMLDYDPLMSLPYLDAVCRETLRVYPGAQLAYRDATRDAVLPLATPVRGHNGELISAIVVPKDTRIIIDMLSCNVDTALWGPDATEWRPERWLEGSVPKTVEEARLPAVYSHMMTFLGGNRACIGFNFAQLEMKAFLFVLLQWFKFEPTGAPIVWNFASVEYPTVGPESIVPELPLKVSLVCP